MLGSTVAQEDSSAIQALSENIEVKEPNLQSKIDWALELEAKTQKGYLPTETEGKQYMELYQELKARLRP